MLSQYSSISTRLLETLLIFVTTDLLQSIRIVMVVLDRIVLEGTHNVFQALGYKRSASLERFVEM